MSHERVEIVRQAYVAYAESGSEQTPSFFARDHVAHAVPSGPTNLSITGPRRFRS
jgi:hypothetical protein